MSETALEFDAEDLAFLNSDTIDVDIDRELSARRLVDYVEIAWSHVEPAVAFQNNFHVGSICDHLEAVKSGEIDRLLMNVPPGAGKSILACVLFPTWCWTDWPESKIISASFDDAIVKRDALRSRTLIESPWWRARWGHRVTPNKAQWASTHYRNKEGGFRYGVTVGSTPAGEHGNIHLVDDPIKPLDVSGKVTVTKASLEKAWLWYTQTMPTRMVDKATAKVSARVLIMQRLHQLDPAGRVLEEAGYVHLCLPMEYEPRFSPGSFARFPGEETQECVIKKCKAEHREYLTEPDDDGNRVLLDPRTEVGELLNPERKTRKAVEVLKRELGARAAAAQLRQSPSPQEGSIFKTTGIRYYHKKNLPKRFHKVVQSWDMTFKETLSGSYVCGQVWAQKGADCYLLSQRRERWGMSDTLQQVREMTVEFPKANKKYVEDKANGSAVVDVLSKDISGFELINPEGGKESRANAIEPMWESGNIWLPHPDEAPWIEDFVEEFLAFPAGANDDQVDCASQALVKLKLRSIERLKQAMANM